MLNEVERVVEEGEGAAVQVCIKWLALHGKQHHVMLSHCVEGRRDASTC